jgi:hypothetical protein
MSSPILDQTTSHSPSPEFVFDRTAVETWEHCPRLRWWHSYALGHGIQPTSVNLDLAVGISTHAMLADVLDQIRRGQFSDNTLKAILDHHCLAFEQELRDRGLSADLMSGYELDEEGNVYNKPPSVDFSIGLYSCWMRQMVTAWTYIRAPQLLKEYAIVEVEREELMPVLDFTGMFMSRLDALLRRHDNGDHFILNFKTTGNPDNIWREQWRHDIQTLSEVLPVEARLGLRISGVLIEGLVKGRRNKTYPYGSDDKWNSSPLVWSWKKAAEPPFASEYAAKYEWTDEFGHGHRLGKGFRSQPVWEDAEMSPIQWLRWLHDREPELLAQQFVSLPPILRSDYDVARWQQQVLPREQHIAQAGRYLVKLPESLGTKERELDRLFPMHTSNANCLRPKKCWAYELCHGYAASDPLNNNFTPREVNHPFEEQVIKASNPSA